MVVPLIEFNSFNEGRIEFKHDLFSQLHVPAQMASVFSQ